MDGGSDYNTAWWIYLAAAAGAQCLLWWLLRSLRSVDLKWLLHLLLLALLITPTALEPGQNYWVPAYMAAFMDGLDSGFEAAMPRLWPILIVLAVLLSLWLAGKVLWRRRQARQTAQSKSLDKPA